MKHDKRQDLEMQYFLETQFTRIRKQANIFIN